MLFNQCKKLLGHSLFVLCMGSTIVEASYMTRRMENNEGLHQNAPWAPHFYQRPKATPGNNASYVYDRTYVTSQVYVPTESSRGEASKLKIDSVILTLLKVDEYYSDLSGIKRTFDRITLDWQGDCFLCSFGRDDVAYQEQGNWQWINNNYSYRVHSNLPLRSNSYTITAVPGDSVLPKKVIVKLNDRVEDSIAAGCVGNSCRGELLYQRGSELVFHQQHHAQ